MWGAQKDPDFALLAGEELPGCRRTYNFAAAAANRAASCGAGIQSPGEYDHGCTPIPGTAPPSAALRGQAGKWAGGEGSRAAAPPHPHPSWPGKAFGVSESLWWLAAEGIIIWQTPYEISKPKPVKALLPKGSPGRSFWSAFPEAIREEGARQAGRQAGGEAPGPGKKGVCREHLTFLSQHGSPDGARTLHLFATGVACAGRLRLQACGISPALLLPWKSVAGKPSG